MTEHRCKNQAAYSYIWPTDGLHVICEEHFPKLKAIAEAMGLHLAVSRMSEATENFEPMQCEQKVSS